MLDELRRYESILVRRNGRETKVPLPEVKLSDEFNHSGMWWQLCTSRSQFLQVEEGRPFKHQHSWFVVDREGVEPMVRKLNPNIPFGEPSRLCVSPPFLATVGVDVLDLKPV
jgi:hypothetical protein